ncbi:MAG TPA: Na(+)/H(+) antiporter subunit C [Terrimesophilobacter sp.]|nr:Na(+)/H(+) antiporter subunit C [Terrimesophilobacter sp.]
MSVSLVLIIVMAVLYAAGIYLLLERSLTRMLLGFMLVGNATNLLILIVSGPAGRAPFYGEEASIADPLPQAFVLTSIVITFGVSAFLMALIYRSWRLAHVDDVIDDSDDVALAHRDATVTSEEAVETSDDTEFGTTATAAVSTALDLEEVERAEEAQLHAEREAAEREAAEREAARKQRDSRTRGDHE